MAESRILMVVTNQDRIDDDHPTGLWLEEFAVPFNAFREAGIKVSVASPRGGGAPVDPRSEPTGEQIRSWGEAISALAETGVLETVRSSDFEGIFLPGGHGTMFDLTGCSTLKEILGDFAAENKVVAAVCHGPAGLMETKRPDGLPLVAGKRMTAFTNMEEKDVRLDRLMPFLLETRLRELGADFVAAPNWTVHVEIDDALITGQNPQSSHETARAVIGTLKGKLTS